MMLDHVLNYLKRKSPSENKFSNLLRIAPCLYYLLSFPNKKAHLFTLRPLEDIDSSLIFNDPNNP